MAGPANSAGPTSELINDFFIQEFSALGWRFQNMMYSEFKKSLMRGAGSLHYWRTKDGAEVDFVVDYGKRIIPIEVKLQAISRGKPPGGLRRFIKKYQPDTAYVVNLNHTETVVVQVTQVHFVPYYQMREVLETTEERHK